MPIVFRFIVTFMEKSTYSLLILSEEKFISIKIWLDRWIVTVYSHSQRLCVVTDLSCFLSLVHDAHIRHTQSIHSYCNRVRAKVRTATTATKKYTRSCCWPQPLRELHSTAIQSEPNSRYLLTNELYRIRGLHKYIYRTAWFLDDISAAVTSQNP